MLLWWHLPTLVSIADETTLAHVGDEWAYWKGTGEPSSPLTAWRQLGFDDSHWSTSPSGIGSAAGYPASIATPLPDMPFNYVSIYMRHKFTVLAPSAIKWLVLRLDYDGGFIAYLNGVEIARRGLPGAAGTRIFFNTPAAQHPAGAAEEIDVTPFSHLLQQGDNVLAIQAHNSSWFPSSFVIVPELLANFQRGPFVQNASAGTIQVVWKTPVATDSSVEFGLTQDLGTSSSDPRLSTNHVISLTGLEPGTRYYYRVRSSDGALTATSPTESFRTLKDSGPLRFVMLGDSGFGTLNQLRVARLITNAQPDLVLHAGDVIYPSFTSGLVDTRCLSIYGQHMRSTPYYFALGNHDLYSGPEAYLDAFYLPTNSVSPAEHLLAGTSPEH